MSGEIISTIAGNGIGGYNADGILATNSFLHDPSFVTLDNTESVFYISDQINSRIRRFTDGGNISTVAGNGAPGYTGNGGPGTSASIGYTVFFSR